MLVNRNILTFLFFLRTQQERMKKRMEFENQRNRILNQLEFEKTRDTSSKLRFMKSIVIVTMSWNCHVTLPGIKYLVLITHTLWLLVVYHSAVL
jgi:hypothetical protein